jgi:hypothetical protein
LRLASWSVPDLELDCFETTDDVARFSYFSLFFYSTQSIRNVPYSKFGFYDWCRTQIWIILQQKNNRTQVRLDLLYYISLCWVEIPEFAILNVSTYQYITWNLHLLHVKFRKYWIFYQSDLFENLDFKLKVLWRI